MAEDAVKITIQNSIAVATVSDTCAAGLNCCGHFERPTELLGLWRRGCVLEGGWVVWDGQGGVRRDDGPN